MPILGAHYVLFVVLADKRVQCTRHLRNTVFSPTRATQVLHQFHAHSIAHYITFYFYLISLLTTKNFPSSWPCRVVLINIKFCDSAKYFGEHLSRWHPRHQYRLQTGMNYLLGIRSVRQYEQ